MQCVCVCVCVCVCRLVTWCEMNPVHTVCVVTKSAEQLLSKQIISKECLGM